MLEGIKDDVDFCMKLCEEESVIVLPGKTVSISLFIAVGKGFRVLIAFDNCRYGCWIEELASCNFCYRALFARRRSKKDEGLL